MGLIQLMGMPPMSDNQQLGKGNESLSESKAGKKGRTPEEERRKHKRLMPREGHVVYGKLGFLSFLGGKARGAIQPIVNISKSGVCFPVNEKFKEGQKLRLRVHLGKAINNLDLEARVIWMGRGTGQFRYRAGCQFTEYYGEAWNVLSNLEKYIKPRTRTLFTLRGRKNENDSSDDI